MGESEADSKSQPSSVEGTNVKETIESILVAFILAFVFRAFVLEAFVIPTGSMATTLLGAHLRLTCPDCGYQFDVNYGNGDSDRTDIPSQGTAGTAVYCPNCGYPVSGGQQVQNVYYGDRILVLKYIYLLHPPHRWDVVVFKSPSEPNAFHYTQNFIKRLIGRPGEEIMVLDGDIYISTDHGQNWQIQTKPPKVQEAMWRLVYDNDYYPHGLTRGTLDPWQQPWKPAGGVGWTTDGRVFAFGSAQGQGTLRFDPFANSTSQTLTDYLAYDSGTSPRRPGEMGSPSDEMDNPVNDVKLCAYYTRTGGDGPLRLYLRRSESADHIFVAEIDRDSVRLLHQVGDEQSEFARAKLSDLGFSPGQPLYIEFQNVDYRVTLRLNGREVFAPLDYPPNVAWLESQWQMRRRGKSAQVWIEASKQSSTLAHLSLWRDVYYTSRSPGDGGMKWAMPDNPIQLGPSEYFVMGDNSAISSDARYWTHRIDLPHEGLVNVDSGRVPEQFMLGQAVFVYWPAGFRLMGSRLGAIPDFGDMRWIH